MPATKKKDQVPDGFTCSTCDTFHEFSAYVYAHTHVELTHTCDQCGAQHSILNLVATQTKKGQKKND